MTQGATEFHFEVFINKGEKEGTETITSTETLNDAVRQRNEYYARVSSARLHIDLWVNGEPYFEFNFHQGWEELLAAMLLNDARITQAERDVICKSTAL